MYLTTAFHKIAALKHRNKVIQGSQGASKTYSILQKWIYQATQSNHINYCSIVTDTFPNLRNGAIKDFLTICEKNGIGHYSTKHPTVIKINRWTFEFFSVDKETKGLGGRRDRLFLNEANRMPWRIARQLINRTHKERIFDFNPVQKFWAHTEFVDVCDCDFVKLTYKDNEMLPESERQSIEKYAPEGLTPDVNFWRVYGLGEIGFKEGQVFKGYKTYSGDVHYDLHCYGLDFGWEDPMAIVKVMIDKTKKSIYAKEMFYGGHALFEDVLPYVKGLPDYEPGIFLCDHSPGDIMKLRQKPHNLKAMSADKSGGIINNIRTLKQYRIFVHVDSKNLLNEMENYSYKKNKGMAVTRTSNIEMETFDREQTEFDTGEYTNVPEANQLDHAIDAMRYGATFLIR